MQTQYLNKSTSKKYERFAGTYKKGETQLVIGKNNDGLFLNSSADKISFTLYRTKDGFYIIEEKPDHLELAFDEEQEMIVQLRFFQDCGKAFRVLLKVQ